MTHRHLRLVKFEPTEPVSETRLRAEEPSQMTRIPPPQDRGDCAGKHRPCPWIHCRYSLVGEPGTAERGRLYHFNNGDHETPLESLEHTCALDVTDEGEHTLEAVGKHLGITRERVRQIEEKAMEKVRAALAFEGYSEQDVQDMFASLMSVAHPQTDGQSDEHTEPEPADDPWTAMAMRALDRLEDVGDVDEDAVLAAYRALAAELGERPAMQAVKARAGFRGSVVSVWRVCAAAKTLPFWKGRAE